VCSSDLSHWGLRRDDVVELAFAVECTYLSFRVHRFIRDGKLPEQVRQYGILFGDFFAAQALVVLSRDPLFTHYSKFTNLIQTMNEGMLLRRSFNRPVLTAAEWREVLTREKAALALPGRVMAAWLSLGNEEARELEALAAELGVLWGAREEGLPELARGSRNAAEQMLNRMADSLPREELRGFLQGLAD
jgi:hypothetical protein